MAVDLVVAVWDITSGKKLKKSDPIQCIKDGQVVLY